MKDSAEEVGYMLTLEVGIRPRGLMDPASESPYFAGILITKSDDLLSSPNASLPTDKSCFYIG